MHTWQISTHTQVHPQGDCHLAALICWWTQRESEALFCGYTFYIRLWSFVDLFPDQCRILAIIVIYNHIRHIRYIYIYRLNYGWHWGGAEWWALFGPHLGTRDLCPTGVEPGEAKPQQRNSHGLPGGFEGGAIGAQARMVSGLDRLHLALNNPKKNISWNLKSDFLKWKIWFKGFKWFWFAKAGELTGNVKSYGRLWYPRCFILPHLPFGWPVQLVGCGLVDDISPPWLVGPTFEGIYPQPAFRTKACPPWKSCKYIASSYLVSL